MSHSKTDVFLRVYDALHDAEAIFALYQTCLQNRWPLSADIFHRLISQHADYRPGDHFVAEKAGHILGFVGTQMEREFSKPIPKGGIGLLLVHPEHHRQGIGKQLHDLALLHLTQAGLRDISTLR